MEIGETLKGIFRRESADREEVIMERVVDILSRQAPVLVHATSLKKRDILLRCGLESGMVANMTGNKHYESHTSSDMSGDPHVWFEANGSFRVMATNSSDFGIIARPTGKIYRNTPALTPIERLLPGYVVVVLGSVPPQEFAAFVLPAFDVQWKPRLKKLMSSMRKAGLELPVYDRFGNLIWPIEMSHEEIVQMLVERQKQGQMAESEAK